MLYSQYVLTASLKRISQNGLISGEDTFGLNSLETFRTHKKCYVYQHDKTP